MCATKVECYGWLMTTFVTCTRSRLARLESRGLRINRVHGDKIMNNAHASRSD